MLHFKKPNRKHFNSLKDCNRLIEFRLTTNLNSSSIMNNGIPWITSFPQTMWTQGREMSLGIITKSLLSASAFTRFRTYQFIFYQDYCQEARRKEKKKKKSLHKAAACLSFILLVRWIGQRKETDIGNSCPFNNFGYQNAICRSILAE